MYEQEDRYEIRYCPVDGWSVWDNQTWDWACTAGSEAKCQDWIDTELWHEADQARRKGY